MKYKLIEIARSSKAKAEKNQDKLKGAYEKLMTTTGRVVAQARTFIKEIRTGIKRAATPMKQLIVDSLATYLD